MLCLVLCRCHLSLLSLYFNFDLCVFVSVLFASLSLSLSDCAMRRNAASRGVAGRLGKRQAAAFVALQCGECNIYQVSSTDRDRFGDKLTVSVVVYRVFCPSCAIAHDCHGLFFER